MKKIVLMITCVLLTSVAFQACKPNDQKLNTEVENALKERHPSVSSSTMEGVVTLTGMVESQQEKMAAGESARAVKNVKDVVNNIQVREPVPAAPVVNPDTTIRTDIMSKLEAGGYKGVKVEVNNGEVTLSGDVKRSDLTKVMQIANESNPKKVTNNIKTK